MRLRALRQQREAAKSAALAIIQTAQNEGRALTDAEDAQVKEAETQVSDLSRQIEAAEALEARMMALAPAGGLPGLPQPVSYGQTQVGADRAALDPRGGFAGMADFARAVMQGSAGASDFRVDQRLTQISAAGEMRETGSRDGYAVPPDFRDRIWQLVHQTDSLISMTDEEPTSSTTINDMTDDVTPWGGNGVTVRWRSEATQMTASAPTPPKPRALTLEPLYAFVKATDELLQDAPRLQSRLEAKSAEAISWKLDEAVINGTGVGQMLGYMKSGALVTVAKETSQTADTFTADNAANMLVRMLPGSVGNAVWLMNQDVLPQLMKMVIGSQLVWTPPSEGFKGAPGGFLLGRPIRWNEHCATLGDLGDVQLVDLKGYYSAYRTGDRQFASSLTSISITA